MTSNSFRIARTLSIGTFAVLAASMAVLSAGVACGWSTALYSSWPMTILWCLLIASAILVICVTKLWRHPFVLAIHAAFLLILLGALVTHLTGTEGIVHLRPGECTDSITTEQGETALLSSRITLKTFDIETYPGTNAPKDFICTLTDDTGNAVTASLNSPGHIDGCAILPASYDADGDGVTLNVSRDPVGRPLTFAGYILLAVALIGYFFGRRSQWRIALRRLSATAVAILLFSITAKAELSPEASDAFNTLAVYHNDRICPVSVLARDFTATITGGASSFDGHSAEEVFEGFVFDFGHWKYKPIIRVKDKELCSILGGNGHVSYADFFDAVVSGRIDAEHPGDSRKRTDIDRFEAVNMVVSGELLKVFPVCDSTGLATWYAPTDRLPADMDGDKWMFVRKALGLLNEQVLCNDGEAQCQILEAIGRYQRHETAGMLPSPGQLSLERTYAGLAAGYIPAIVTVIIGILLYILMATGRIRPHLLRRLGLAAASLLWLWLTAIIILRWIVCGHVPMSNGYETMQFLAWCLATVTIVFYRIIVLPPMGILTAGLAMCVASMTGAGASVTGLMPVLNSPLLSVHVAMMMLSYALFMLMALTGVTAMIRSKDAARLADISRVMLYPALALLTIGIFVGAVWASVSWGRYWGWDPKEVWALVTMIVYALPAHPSLLPALTRPRTYHIYMVVAFISVLITYFGVNFILGGLHGYA